MKDLIRSEFRKLSTTRTPYAMLLGATAIIILGVIGTVHDASIAQLSVRHPGTAPIGTVTADTGRVTLPSLGLAGDASGLARALGFAFDYFFFAALFFFFDGMRDC